jgi:NADH-quinone oxidoreductase subunit K
MHLVYPAALSALLFSVGIYGVLARRNAVLILMSIEIMLNAVNINLIAFDAWLRDPLMGGQIFALFVITVAAAEVGVGLAIVLLIFRNRDTVDLDSLRELSDAPPARTPRTREEAPVR